MPASPPKCWIYGLTQQSDVNQDLERAKIYDLETCLVDPLEYLIGFYSVVGKKLFEEAQTVIS